MKRPPVWEVFFVTKTPRFRGNGVSLFRKKNLTSSGTPQQQQPRKRSYRPWGCYLRPGSPSSQQKIRLTAAFLLCRNGFSMSYLKTGCTSFRTMWCRYYIDGGDECQACLNILEPRATSWLIMEHLGVLTLHQRTSCYLKRNDCRYGIKLAKEFYSTPKNWSWVLL